MRAPNGLKAGGKRLWTQIAEEFDLEETPEVALLLEQACRTRDLVDRLQALVDAAPSLQIAGSRGQPAPLPELTELRQYRAQLAALIKQLDLQDDEEVVVIRDERQKMTRSEAGKVAAMARWNRRYGHGA
jgi:hypothetical protein